MATEIFINIKDLPELTEIVGGDYIVVETSTGTKIIDFQNLIIPKANTMVSTTVEQNAQVLTDLSTTVDQFSAAYDNSLSNVVSGINALSTRLNDLSGKVTQIYVGKTQVTISSRSSKGSNNLSPSTSLSLVEGDIVVTPANAYAATYPAYVSSIASGRVELTGSFNASKITYNMSLTPILSVSDVLPFLNTASLSTYPIAAEEDAVYNVFAIKTF